MILRTRRARGAPREAWSGGWAPDPASRGARAWSAGLLAAALLAGCGPAGKPAKPGAFLPADRRARVIRELPPERQLTLGPEGVSEPATFRSFIGPCSTLVGYLPAGWIASTPSGCRRLVIRPVRGGRALSTSAVVVEFAPPEMDSTQVYDLAVAENLVAWQWREEHRDPWTLREADFARWVGLKHTIGRTLVGRHSGRYFWISAYYPLEVADYMVPRFRAILDAWIWTDTGEPLDPRIAHRRVQSKKK